MVYTESDLLAHLLNEWSKEDNRYNSYLINLIYDIVSKARFKDYDNVADKPIIFYNLELDKISKLTNDTVNAKALDELLETLDEIKIELSERQYYNSWSDYE